MSINIQCCNSPFPKWLLSSTVAIPFYGDFSAATSPSFSFFNYESSTRQIIWPSTLILMRAGLKSLGRPREVSSSPTSKSRSKGIRWSYSSVRGKQFPFLFSPFCLFLLSKSHSVEWLGRKRRYWVLYHFVFIRLHFSHKECNHPWSLYIISRNPCRVY